MTRNVICVGTIWDLDELVYPERDDYSDMTRRNFRQLVKFQLSSSKKEMSDVVKLPLFPRNQHGIRVRACCASCLLKEITQEGKRLQVKFAFIGALKDVGVLNCSYNALASNFTVTGIDSATLAKYMGYGKKKNYFEWLKQYVNQE